jgi:hypothetical protein
MNKKIKKEWVEALRSNEYTQGKKVLRDLDNNFCCLGVLCDIYNKKQTIDGWLKRDGIFLIDGYNGILPKNVREWAEVDSSPRVCIKSETNHLTSLNDNGMTFLEIANLIEEQF